MIGKCNKQLKEAADDATKVLAREQKKADFAIAAQKEDTRKQLEKADGAIPPSAEKELTKVEDELRAETAAREKASSDLVKAEAKVKEIQAHLAESTTKTGMKIEDCEARERSLQKSSAAADEKAKVLQVKLDEKENTLNRKDAEIRRLKQELQDLQTVMKTKEEILTTTTQKLNAGVTAIAKCENKYKMTMAKLSSGEGALMAEIETLKLAADQSTEEIAALKNTANKQRMENMKTQREKNAATVKYREAAQELFSAKRDTEKYKVKFDTLTSAHNTVTERYRSANSRLELCSDRTKDAKIKAQGCEEAMRRMKTYNTDQQNEQKLEVARLRTELETAKSDAAKLQVSQEEKAQSAAMAKEATEKAVADAVAAAQAKGLAVQTTAQEAVDKAAKEAVRLANQQANAANSN